MLEDVFFRPSVIGGAGASTTIRAMEVGSDGYVQAHNTWFTIYDFTPTITSGEKTQLRINTTSIVNVFDCVFTDGSNGLGNVTVVNASATVNLKSTQVSGTLDNSAGAVVNIDSGCFLNATVGTITDRRWHLPKSKSITIEKPSSSEDISFFFTNRAITITEMRAVLQNGSTPSVTWTVRHGTDRSGAGAEVVTGGTTTTSETTGSDVTSFNDATVVADSFLNPRNEETAQQGDI